MHQATILVLALAQLIAFGAVIFCAVYLRRISKAMKSLESNLTARSIPPNKARDWGRTPLCSRALAHQPAFPATGL